MRKLIHGVRSNVRHKLLVLVLFPILLIMPIALVVAIYWGSHYSSEQLRIKVNTDLSVSHDIFRRIREDYLNRLGRLAESYSLNTALETGSSGAVNQQLDNLRNTAGLSYLHLLDPQGRRLFSADDESIRGVSSPSLLAATQGMPRVGVEIFSVDQLAAISPELVSQVRLRLITTPRARPTERNFEDRGMLIRALYPVKSSRGEVMAILDGGVLLNGNFEFVDTIRDLVYGAGSLLEGSIGTVTVFLDDVRISTNVPLRPGERALGTRVSEEVRNHVLDRGDNWIARAFVVNDWYISSYEPIIDVNGRRVGMLYAGFLEAPFKKALWQALAVVVLMFLLLMLLATVIAVRGAKSIFRPLEIMSDVVRATRAGEEKRIGPVTSRDEIGELAREFDAMLARLQERNHQIQEWADKLEDKVELRTAELRNKNQELRRAIQVLRDTREQLIVAEKLAALGEVTAGVAHEINNPTAVMLGNLDLLVDELGDAALPVKQEIDLVIEQIYRIKDITNDLLQYARPEQYAGHVAMIDVNEVIQHTLSLVRHLHSQTSFGIELDLGTVQPVQISAQELQQVLVNLIVNAIHALGTEGGSVRLRSRDWQHKGVVIEIEDNGEGMGAEQLAHIFNPFYSTKGRGEGTGLGLSVSYSMIRRYGGDITVVSEPGKGSVFSIWLLHESKPVKDEKTLVEQLRLLETGETDMEAERPVRSTGV